MNSFNRSLTSIKRSFGKSFILFLLVFIIGTATTSAIAIRNSVRITDNNLRRNMLPVVMITENISVMLNSCPHTDPRWMPGARGGLISSLLYPFAELPYVKYFDHSLSTQVGSYNDLRKWVHELTPTFGMGSSFYYPELGYKNVFSLNGVSNPSFLDKKMGLIEMIEGNTFTEEQLNLGEQVAVVSDLWAHKNNIKLGDTIFLVTDDWDWETGERIYYFNKELKIIGIFEVYQQENFDWSKNITGWSMNQHRFLNLNNNIYTPNLIVREAKRFRHYHWNKFHGLDFENGNYDALGPQVFVLHDPDYVESFSNLINPYLPGFYEAHNLFNRYEPISKSMESLLEISDFIMNGAIIMSVLTLGLVTALFLSDRRREIGIYLALGEKKTKIVFQIIFEICLISINALVLSIIFGNLLSNQLSRNMIYNQISTVDVGNRNHLNNEIDMLERLGFGAPMSAEEMLVFFDTSLNTATIVNFFTVGVLTVGVSITIPLVYMMKINVKKVLL